MTDLDKLIAAVEAGECPDFCPMWHGDGLCVEAEAALNGSLDAALRLHNALLPGVAAVVQTNGTVQTVAGAPGWDRHTAVSENNPARAWLLAILRALKAKGDA